MKKQELDKLRTLKATPEMLRMAAADTPQREKKYSWEHTIYKYALYMRCRVQNDILMVAFFLTENMRLGSDMPAYELFIDREKKQFLTYDRLHDKWMTAKLDRINWPAYFFYSKENWMNQFEATIIKHYLGGERGGYEGLLDFQRVIRCEELEKRHKKETDPWDRHLAQTPKLPRDWERWVDKVGIPQNYIFYNYVRKGAESGYCTYCGKNVPIKNPRYNKQGRCPRCRHEITFKSFGKAGTIITDNVVMYLIQRCTDGFVIREFTGSRKYRKGGYYEPERCVSEIRRVIYDKNANYSKAYYWGLYKQREYRWIATGPCSLTWHDDNGKVYGKTLPSLSKRELSHSGLRETLSSFDIIDPEKYLAVLHDAPYLERLAKANLPRLVSECLSSTSSFSDGVCDANATSLTKLLGVNTQELKRLRQNMGGMRFLDWLRYENATNTYTPDCVINWYCSQKITAKDIQFINDRMSAVQIYNYLRRQMSVYSKKSTDILRTWADYLSMAKRLQMDTNDAIVFRVNKLYRRHDELVELCHDKDLAIRASEIMEQYPLVDNICGHLKEKYDYGNETYTVISPSCIEDILLESRALHHCVDDDRYFDRIARRETYILFLRKTSEVNKPYYTLEVEPNGTVRQKRTLYDRQNADIEDATKFLAEWQTEIAKRINEADRKLAEESRVLRNQEFAQLRDSRAIIHTGELAGQLLVDVLVADLMENTATEKAA